MGEELQASLARYACVLVNGYLEASCREILTAYSKARAEVSVTRYVQMRLKLFSDPNVEKILQLVGDFDPNRRKALESVLDERLKDGINSIHAHRNNIAHGRQSSISVGQIRQYFSAAQEVVAKLKGAFPGGGVRQPANGELSAEQQHITDSVAAADADVRHSGRNYDAH